MLGFLFGLACLGGLFYYLSHHGLHGEGGAPRGSWYRRLWLRRIFSRLETTPGQEKVIRESLEALQEEGRGARQQLRSVREELATVLREEELAPDRVDEVLRKHETALEGLRGGTARALTQVHAALDSQQRSRLADWLTSAAQHGRCGPGRRVWA